MIGSSWTLTVPAIDARLSIPKIRNNYQMFLAKGRLAFQAIRDLWPDLELFRGEVLRSGATKPVKSGGLPGATRSSRHGGKTCSDRPFC